MTLTLTNFFGLIGGLLVLAYVANRLSHRTRVPDVIVLLASGVVLGPVLHWIQAGRFPGLIRGVGTLALILILFAAGLELDLRRARRQFLAGTVLAVLSYGLTMIGITIFCTRALHLSRMPALIIAACLACMSGSIILPILGQLSLRADLKTTLVIEASFGDGLGALVLGVLLSLLDQGSTHRATGGAILGSMAGLFIYRFLLAFVIAIIAGYFWARLLPHISHRQFWQALTFAAVLMVYSGTNAVGGSELFAVMVFGATLASLLGPESFLREFGFEVLTPEKSGQIYSFHSELAFLVRSFFFVLLGAMIQFRGLRGQILSSLGILVVIVVARAVSITTSRIAWPGTSFREREFALLLIPRGLITAVLALEAIQAMPSALSFLPSLVFALILLTNGLVLVASIRARAIAAEARDESPVSANS